MLYAESSTLSLHEMEAGIYRAECLIGRLAALIVQASAHGRADRQRARRTRRLLRRADDHL